MSAWTAGDSKRLWHSLVKPVSVKYTEAEQQLDMKLTYVNSMDFEVRRARGGGRHSMCAGWGVVGKPLNVKYTEAEQQLDIKLTYIDSMNFEVRRGRMWGGG
jgi:hypothetical protein